jgi:hypothetical protein
MRVFEVRLFNGNAVAQLHNDFEWTLDELLTASHLCSSMEKAVEFAEAAYLEEVQDFLVGSGELTEDEVENADNIPTSFTLVWEKDGMTAESDDDRVAIKVKIHCHDVGC